MSREPLPPRRFAATRELRWPPDRGIGTVQVSVGFYGDERGNAASLIGAVVDLVADEAKGMGTAEVMGS